jgi:hypothetical protein
MRSIPNRVGQDLIPENLGLRPCNLPWDLGVASPCESLLAHRDKDHVCLLSWLFLGNLGMHLSRDQSDSGYTKQVNSVVPGYYYLRLTCDILTGHGLPGHIIH